MPAGRQEPLLADKLDLIAASPQSELLGSFWNSAGRRGTTADPPQGTAAAPTSPGFFAKRPRPEPRVRSRVVPDRPFVSHDPDDRGVIATQWGTFLFSAVAILVMLTLAFRSPFLAVLAIVPTLLSIVLVLGLMGWLKIQLDMATALVASVALGLSVDDTFHCLLQFHRDRNTRRFRRRLFESYRVSGPGVLLSSLAVAIGFAALRASEFEPFVNFGTMVGIATAGSTLGNLVLLSRLPGAGRALASQHAIGLRRPLACSAAQTAPVASLHQAERAGAAGN